MKVLLIHPRFAQLGGLESRLINYADYFASRSHEVHIACRRYDKHLVKQNMFIHRFQPLFFNAHNKNYLFNKKLEKWNKPDFDFELSLGRTTIQKNILAPATHKGYMMGIGKTVLTRADERYIEMDLQGYQTSEHIFAASAMVKNEVVNLYGINESKVHILYPPFNAALHKKYSEDEKKKIRKKYGLPENKIFHLFVSSSHALKGIELLEKVFGKLTDTNHVLLVIGKPIKSNLPNVYSLGYFNLVSEAYALGNYILHPSKYDAFAQVITEALYHELPVVVSPTTGAKEILNEKTGIVAPNREVDTWIEIIRSLSSNTFDISPSFILDMGLDLESHMRQMLAVNGISLE